MARDVAALLGALDLAATGRDLFEGTCPPTGRARVFGGLVVAQALAAAVRTVPDRAPDSLHAYFLLPGDPARPIVYRIERLRDGRSFATRRCTALQDGRTIFEMLASFHREEGGLDHQVAMPAAPTPEALADLATIVAHDPGRLPAGLASWLAAEGALEVRVCDPALFGAGAAPASRRSVWLRAAAPLPDDPAVHRLVLAYLSDFTLIDVALGAHGRSLFEPAFDVASLDHALWFHRPFRADDWLLYAQDSPSTAAARGLARGTVFTRDGVLAASVAQQGLIRTTAAG